MTTTPNACGVDIEFFERELASFLPDRIYDAHTHLWRKDCVSWSTSDEPEDLGYKRYMSAIDEIHGGRPTKALFIPFVTADNKEMTMAANEWVSEAIADDPDCRGIFFIKPEDDPEWVRQEVRRLGLHGLKCYHTMAPSVPTWEAGRLH